jgi:hypothetical protein
MKKLTVFLATFLISFGLMAQTSNIFDLTDTGTTFDAIKMAVTDTASAADSKLLNLTATSGGVFQVNKNGDLTTSGLVDGRDVAADGALVDTAVQPADNVSVLTNDAGYLTAVPAQEGTSILSTGEVGGTKFLREDGDGTSSWQAVPPSYTSPLTTKGDIFTYDTGDQRLAIGTDGFVLTADSAEATGIKWAASGALNNVVEDTTPQLGGDLDGQSFNITHSGTLLTDGIGILDASGIYNRTTDAGTMYFAGGDSSTSGSGVTLFGGTHATQASDIYFWGGGYSAGSVVFWYDHSASEFLYKNTTIKVEEQVSAHADTSGYGQIWIKDDTPNTIWFTDDAGTDFQLGAGGGFTSFVDDETNGNYAIGLNALDSIIAGGLDNIAIGENAGTALTTSDNGVYIGTDAGLLVTSGSDNNTAVGFNSLKTAGANATDNTGLGYYSLRSITGDDNTALGSGALDVAGNVSRNTAIGHDALGSMTANNANDNVAVGVFCGLMANDIDYSVFIGSGAGASVTDSDYSVFIGGNVGELSATNDDQFVVGNGTHNAISGYFGARSDVDYSGRSLTLHGPSAWVSAVTNTSAGNLDLKMGDHATAGGSAGLVRILAPDDTVALSVDEDGDLAGKTFIADLANDNYSYGEAALDSITVGSGLDNLAWGENAATAISSGDGNIAIGTSSLLAATTSGGTIAIGHEALKGWTSTSDHNAVFIGNRAGLFSTGCGGCVAIGNLAARSGTGDSSIFIGDSAGYNSSGTQNTVVGFSALSQLSSGRNNVMLGAYAGWEAGGTSYSIFIGSDPTEVHASNDDQIVIGSGDNRALFGYLGARSDLDYSGKSLTVSGPSAYSAASTNQDGGNLILQAGQKASGGGTNGLTLVNDTVYGIMSVQANVTGEATVDGTPRKVAAWNTDGLSNGMTADSTTGDDLTCDTAGTYIVTFNASFSGTNSSVVTLEIYKNGSATGFALTRTLNAAGAVGAAGINGIVNCAATDTIEVYQSSTGSALTVEEGQMSAYRISQ